MLVEGMILTAVSAVVGGLVGYMRQGDKPDIPVYKEFSPPTDIQKTVQVVVELFKTDPQGWVYDGKDWFCHKEAGVKILDVTSDKSMRSSGLYIEEDDKSLKQSEVTLNTNEKSVLSHEIRKWIKDYEVRESDRVARVLAQRVLDRRNLAQPRLGYSGEAGKEPLGHSSSGAILLPYEAKRGEPSVQALLQDPRTIIRADKIVAGAITSGYPKPPPIRTLKNGIF